MFRNRSIQVKLVKDQKNQVDDTNEPLTVAAVADIALEATGKAIYGATVLLAAYLAGDTLRRVTIHIVATKIK
jgi:hypothetical protein